MFSEGQLCAQSLVVCMRVCGGGGGEVGGAELRVGGGWRRHQEGE